MPGTGQLVGNARFIQKMHANGHIRLDLVMEPVNAALPKKGQPGNGKGDGVRNAGFPTAIAAGNGGKVSEVQRGRLLIGLEAGDCHVGDLKVIDFFQNVRSFLCHAAVWVGSTLYASRI